MSRLPLDLAARVRAGERLVGALVRLPCEEIVEMLAVAGHDFVLLDCEHGPADVTVLRAHIALAQVHGVEVVVRVGEGERALILRALDAGASGILAPHVDTPEQARDLVAACHYPPLGERGFATYGRAGGYGNVSAADHKARYARGTLVLAMPESPASAANADAIMAVDGLDGYMIGVADLAASSGPGDPTPEESCRRIHAAGRAGGKARLDIVGSRARAAAALEDGAQVVVYNLTSVLMEAFTDLTRPTDTD
ncbi:HpcH/HpaI aldolase family protein [Agilicoccus flavus]|uniref:HpcH/HpaI aldolase family protein n=1 Tax=Agilicoccus flavus TaxID=2775968 RepID=UPI001CF64038|nr:aldolase/citrate lyase family protein [Agilicoccus flavus]